MIDEKQDKKADILEKLWGTGIVVKRASFLRDVNNSDMVPEGEFNEGSSKPDRKVQMRLVSQGLLCFHKEQYFLIPVSNVKQVFFK
jgi:hypothetical protein